MTQEQPPYHLAARYPNKTPAGKAYDPIQAIIFAEDCDLSAYRFFEQKERKWYVVVLGEEPSPQLPGPSFWWRATVLVLARPRIWWTAVRQALRLARRRCSGHRVGRGGRRRPRPRAGSRRTSPSG